MSATKIIILQGKMLKYILYSEENENNACVIKQTNDSTYQRGIRIRPTGMRKCGAVSQGGWSWLTTPTYRGSTPPPTGWSGSP